MLASIVVVFLSYAHADKALAKTVAAELRSAGCAVWVDEAIKPGTVWTREIQSQIDRADVVVTIVSKAAGKSYWVAAELSRAQRQHKEIVPIIKDADADIPLVLELRQWGTVGHLGEDVGCSAK